ncbi:MAG: DNA double-strand break repair nuclease NurA [Candidatus Aenigmarchaeota archaeon]|nr:DNA double-strand break repair nuclease NurA [Candidatus Aenigmarchaeota archaeon]
MVTIHELDKIIDKIKFLETEKKKLAEFLKKIPDLSWKVSNVDLGNIKIGGEDGGLTKKSGHLMDFVFLRAVSVIFKYENGKLQDVVHYPTLSPTPEITYSPESLSDIEFRIFWSLQRMKKELKISIESINKFSPDLFLIDGSLMVNPGDVPNKEYTVYSDYVEVKNLIAELHETSKKENCLLAGVVEDSRSSAFCNHVAEKILSKIKSPKLPELISILKRTKDTNLLYYMLEKGDVTRVVDLENGVKCIYMKTAEFDRPIRVEFLENEKRIAELVYTISSQSRMYGLPTVLIEADQRAKLSENDTDYYTNLIASKLGLQNIFFLRRDNRPF